MMFSNDKNVETIGQLIEVLKHYIGLQSEFLKLDIVDKVVRLLTVITMTVVLLGLLTLTLIYLSFGAAFALADFSHDRRNKSLSDFRILHCCCSIPIYINIICNFPP